MDVTLDEDEQAIRNFAREVLQNKVPTALVREMEKDALGYPPALWREVVELDWLSLALPEQYGGQGLPLHYLGLLLEEVGRHIAPLPLHSTYTAALTIARHGSDRLCSEVLPRVVAGECILTSAVQEGPRLFAEPSTMAVRGGDEYVISGTKRFVDDAAAATHALVSCASADGVVVLLVDLAAPGVTREPLISLAKDREANIRFDGVRVPASAIIGESGDGQSVLDDLLDLGAGLLTAQMAGATRRNAEFALEYASNRVAFGRPIGAFQSIQHLSADMRIVVDGAELLSREALWRLGSGLPAANEISQAKAFANERCLFVARSSQMIHGGTGFMMEFDLHLWYRRIAAWGLRFGTSSEHRARIAEALLDTPGTVRLGAEQPLAAACPAAERQFAGVSA